MISASSSGSFSKMESFLKNKSRSSQMMAIMNKYGSEGVRVLAAATKARTGRASSSWHYTATIKGTFYSVNWYNSDVEDGFPVAVMIQYGYGTGTGGYVKGHDYINPVIKPVLDKMSNEMWKVVTTA